MRILEIATTIAKIRYDMSYLQTSCFIWTVAQGQSSLDNIFDIQDGSGDIGNGDIGSGDEVLDCMFKIRYKLK